MIPITIAPVLIPPLALPRSADFTSFVAMIQFISFTSLSGPRRSGLLYVPRIALAYDFIKTRS